MERFERIAVRWIVAYILSGLVAIAASLSVTPDMEWLRILLVVGGIAAVVFGVVGLLVNLIDFRGKRARGAKPISPPASMTTSENAKLDIGKLRKQGPGPTLHASGDSKVRIGDADIDDDPDAD